ncbi:MAG: amidohydrolase [Candidatus Parvarchaeota archaeon]
MSNTIIDKKIEDYVISMRRYFHENPELSFKEVNTSRKIEEELKMMGIDSKRIAGTGIIADIVGKTQGKTVAVRADIDALPIKEENDVPYKSKNEGVMHACGHDAHLAMLLGLAMLLARNKDLIDGKVRLLFQPAEESPPGGAIEMIRNGALDGVDFIIGQHVTSTLPSGTVGIYNKEMMANADEFKVRIIGKGGHGGYPHLCTDPVVAAAMVIVDSQTITSRRIDPIKPSVISFGTIIAGTKNNIIPSYAEMTGTTRTLDQSTREEVKRELERVISGICNAHNLTYEFEYVEGYNALVNNERVSSIIEQAAIEVIGKENIIHPPPAMGGDDFSNYLARVPGAYYRLGVGNKDKNITSPLHSPTFDVDESSLKYGVEILYNAVIKLLRL